MIPYKNGKALAAYYCGVFSFIPLLGCILGPIAIILGILGLAHAKKFPKSKGKGHAIAGIVLPIAGYIFWTVIGFVLDIVGK
jgi:predicted permease